MNLFYPMNKFFKMRNHKLTMLDNMAYMYHAVLNTFIDLCVETNQFCLCQANNIRSEWKKSIWGKAIVRNRGVFTDKHTE